MRQILEHPRKEDKEILDKYRSKISNELKALANSLTDGPNLLETIMTFSGKGLEIYLERRIKDTNGEISEGNKDLLKRTLRNTLYKSKERSQFGHYLHRYSKTADFLVLKEDWTMQKIETHRHVGIRTMQAFQKLAKMEYVYLKEFTMKQALKQEHELKQEQNHEQKQEQRQKETVKVE